MKVLLVNAFQSPSVSAGFYHRFLAPMPPISLAYPAAALERAGIDVEVYDDAIQRGDPTRLSEAIRSSRPDIVGLSAVTATMPGVERVARTVRSVSPETKIVMGNVHADVFHESILKTGLADVVDPDDVEVKAHGVGKVGNWVLPFAVYAVYSDAMAFKIATAMAFQNVCQRANPILLEPVINAEILIPEEFMGEVIGDLNTRQGKIGQITNKGPVQVLTARVPLSKMFGYATSLRSISQGRGTFTMQFSHYDKVQK